MTLWDDLGRKMGKHYVIRVKCKNCGFIQEANIPKGEVKESYLKGSGICSNCGVVGMLQLREQEVKERDDKKGKSEKPEFKWM